MHQLGVKKSSNLLLGSGSAAEANSAGNAQPLCPKPRRPGPAMHEFLNPIRCNKHSQKNSDERSGALNMISEKCLQNLRDSPDGREYVCTKCSPACYSGSPPGRTHNPLVHDVQFLHQMELLPPLTRTKLSDKFSFSTTSASPV